MLLMSTSKLLVVLLVLSTSSAALGRSDHSKSSESALAESQSQVEQLKAEVAALRSQLALKEQPINTNLEEDVDAVSRSVLKKIDGSDMIDDFLESGSGKYISEKTMEKLESKVIYTGKGDQPSWEIKGKSLNKLNKLTNKLTGEGVKVTCPCNHSDGKKMSEREALRRILRQVGDIGISEHIASEVLKTKATTGAQYIQKIALATTMMFRCWQSKCSGSTTNQEELMQWGGGTCF
jgi:hypothetical protein